MLPDIDGARLDMVWAALESKRDVTIHAGDIHVSLVWCEECGSYHMGLFSGTNLRPFAVEEFHTKEELAKYLTGVAVMSLLDSFISLTA